MSLGVGLLLGLQHGCARCHRSTGAQRVLFFKPLPRVFMAETPTRFKTHPHSCGWPGSRLRRPSVLQIAAPEQMKVATTAKDPKLQNPTLLQTNMGVGECPMRLESRLNGIVDELPLSVVGEARAQTHPDARILSSCLSRLYGKDLLSLEKSSMRKTSPTQRGHLNPIGQGPC